MGVHECVIMLIRVCMCNCNMNEVGERGRLRCGGKPCLWVCVRGWRDERSVVCATPLRSEGALGAIGKRRGANVVCVCRTEQ